MERPVQSVGGEQFCDHDKDKYKRMQANQGLLSLKGMSQYLESSKETELVEAVIEPEAVHLVQSPNIRISKQ
jgi:hypothetical protein